MLKKKVLKEKKSKQSLQYFTKNVKNISAIITNYLLKLFHCQGFSLFENNLWSNLAFYFFGPGNPPPTPQAKYFG